MIGDSETGERGLREMAAKQWRITTSTDAPGWLDMPEPGDPAADADWLARREAEARRAFGERWSSQHDELVPVLLRSGLERRELGDLVSWQVWPLALPLFATVRARVVPSEALPAWSDSSTLQPWASAGLGEGVAEHASIPLEGLGGALVSTVQYVFDDGADALVVTVPPTPQALLGFVSAGLRQVIDRAELSRPDGGRFRGAGSPRFVVDEGWAA